MREERIGKLTVYVCECGLGYEDSLIAYACEEYKRIHGVDSEDITKHAIYNPRSKSITKAVQTTRRELTGR